MVRFPEGILPSAAIAALVFPLLLAAGCATLSNESGLPEDQKGAIRTVSVSLNVPVPDGFVWTTGVSRVKDEGDAADLVAAVLSPLIRVRPPDWDRNADIRKSVQPSVLVPETLCGAFTSELTNRTSLALVDSGADAVFSFRVESMDWRDTVGSPFTAHSKPRLLIAATLSSSNTVYWQSRVRVAGTYRPPWALAWHMNTYVRKPEILRRSLVAICREAAHILADNFLKKFPTAARTSRSFE